jgi:hypothetical protein
MILLPLEPIITLNNKQSLFLLKSFAKFGHCRYSIRDNAD